MTLAEAVDHLKGNRAVDVADYDKVNAQILNMADMLTTRIVAQFPTSSPDDEPFGSPGLPTSFSHSSNSGPTTGWTIAAVTLDIAKLKTPVDTVDGRRQKCASSPSDLP